MSLLCILKSTYETKMKRLLQQNFQLIVIKILVILGYVEDNQLEMHNKL